jgi:hypothetical protein
MTSTNSGETCLENYQMKAICAEIIEKMIIVCKPYGINPNDLDKFKESMPLFIEKISKPPISYNSNADGITNKFPGKLVGGLGAAPIIASRFKSSSSSSPRGSSSSSQTDGPSEATKLLNFVKTPSESIDSLYTLNHILGIVTKYAKVSAAGGLSSVNSTEQLTAAVNAVFYTCTSQICSNISYVNRIKQVFQAIVDRATQGSTFSPDYNQALERVKYIAKSVVQQSNTVDEFNQKLNTDTEVSRYYRRLKFVGGKKRRKTSSSSGRKQPRSSRKTKPRSSRKSKPRSSRKTKPRSSRKSKPRSSRKTKQDKK